MLHARNTIENRNDLIEDTITKLEPIFGKVKFYIYIFELLYVYIKEYKNIYSKSIDLSC